jgi:hypothetical protein
MLPEPLVVCTYGWGRLLRLYPDRIDINGDFYDLRNITHVQPYYRHIFGISSVRLEVHFQEQDLQEYVQVLRGMPLLPDTQVLVEYLSRWAVANAQRNEKRCLLTRSGTLKETPLPVYQALPVLPVFDVQQTTTFNGQPQVSTAFRLEIPCWMLLRREQRERRLKRLQVERSLREYGFDVASLVQRLQEVPLAQVTVPIRLLPGEHAHYCTEATLCEEPLAGIPYQKYRAKDQGTLMFTNKRIIYLGRKSQLVISYVRLLHVSNLPGALAFLAEHWSKREVFEVPRSLEGAMYLETILKQYRAQLSAEGAGQVRPRDPRAHEACVALLSEDRALSGSRPIEDEITQPLSVVKQAGSERGER